MANKKALSKIFICLILAASLSACASNNITQNNSNNNDNNGSTSDIIFYYGDTCPHCQNVEKFLTDNKISEKINFQSKEIYQNKDNANELMGRAAACGIKEGDIGVPFLWDGSKCLIGQDDIINFFKSKTNVQ